MVMRANLITWNTVTYERRGLRKHRLGPPDVHPQDVKQEEDVLSHNRLVRGYMFPIKPFEHESHVGALRNDRYERDKEKMRQGQLPPETLKEKVEHIQKLLFRSATLVALCVKRRYETSNNFERERRKARDGPVLQITTLSIFAGNLRERHQWMVDLAKGKPYNIMAKKMPLLNKRREELVELMIKYKIPFDRALWTMRITAAMANTPPFRTKKTPLEEYRTLLTLHIFEMMESLYKMKNFKQYYFIRERWQYVTNLTLDAVACGVVERQDMTLDGIELFCHFFLRRLNTKTIENQITLRFFLQYFTKLVKYLPLNVVLSRRAAHMLCCKLLLMRKEYVNFEPNAAFLPPKFKSENYVDYINDNQSENGSLTNEDLNSLAFDECACGLRRQNYKAIVGIIQFIASECPSAIVWQPKFERKNSKRSHCMMESGKSQFKLFGSLQMAHSPFSVLQDCFQELIAKTGTVNARNASMFDVVLDEIKERSKHSAAKWHIAEDSLVVFTKQIECCLNILNTLDSYDILNPNNICHMANSIWNFERQLGTDEIILRIKIIMQWAVTIHREGSYRSIIAAMLIAKYLEKRDAKTFNGISVLDMIEIYWESESPIPDTPNYELEFDNLMMLLNEMMRLELFTHDVFVKSMISLAECNYRTPAFKNYASFFKQYKKSFEEETKKEKKEKMERIERFERDDIEEKENKEIKEESADYEEKEDNSAMEDSVKADELDCDDMNENDDLNENEERIRSIEVKEEPSDENPGSAGKKDDESAFELEQVQPTREDEEEENDLDTIDAYNPIMLPTMPLIYSKPILKYTRPLVSEPRKMWYKHRMLIQLAISPTEEGIPEETQRTLFLYGMSEDRDSNKTELRRIARDISKLWQKKMHYFFYESDDQVRISKRFAPSRMSEHLTKYRRNTYHDQVVICGWCANDLAGCVREFIEGESNMLPTHECIELVCSMYEESKYIFGIIEFALSIIPLLPEVEQTICSIGCDITPGSFSNQFCFSFIGFLSKHWLYFLYSGYATPVYNELYNVVHQAMFAEGYPWTAWAETIVHFLKSIRRFLKTSVNFEDEGVELKSPATLRNQKSQYGFDEGLDEDVTYNEHYMNDIFNCDIRLITYSEYKTCLYGFTEKRNRYSFIVNALIHASTLQRDYDAICDHATFCSNITSQVPDLKEEWIRAIISLCMGSLSSTYLELRTYIDLKCCEIHYGLSTFVMLMGARFAYNVNKLCKSIVGVVFPPIMTKDCWTDYSQDDDYEAGLCLSLLICAKLCGRSDEPFLMSPHYNGTTRKIKTLPQSSDENVLALQHWTNMESIIFPLLSNITILQDVLRCRYKESETDLDKYDRNYLLTNESGSTQYRREYLMIILKTVIINIAEQEWVTYRMYQIVETHHMNAFNDERLKQNCLGQQLLRLGIRRRSEREIMSQLTICNSNSKRALIDKLLSVMNFWNVRATIYDIKLMIKEISPEGAQKHQQQSAIAADALMTEFANAVRELFTTAMKANISMANTPISHFDSSKFRLSQINNFWLIPIFIKLCPEPKNVPTAFQPMKVSGKFLKAAARLLEFDVNGKKPFGFNSAWYLQQPPFVNVIEHCIVTDKGTYGRDSKDFLLQSIYRQLTDVMVRRKEALLSEESLEQFKDGVCLRVLFAGRLMKHICSPLHAEPWALLLTHALLSGFITIKSEQIVYNYAYDMLTTILMWCTQDDSAKLVNHIDTDATRIRYMFYATIIKRIRKEIADKMEPGQNADLQALLPIPKAGIRTITTEPHGSRVVQNPNQSVPTVIVTTESVLQPVENIRISAYDMVSGYMPDPTSRPGNWRWQMFQPNKFDEVPPAIPRRIWKRSIHKHQHLKLKPPVYVSDEMLDFYLRSPEQIKDTRASFESEMNEDDLDERMEVQEPKCRPPPPPDPADARISPQLSPQPPEKPDGSPIPPAGSPNAKPEESQVSPPKEKAENSPEDVKPGLSPGGMKSPKMPADLKVADSTTPKKNSPGAKSEETEVEKDAKVAVSEESDDTESSAPSSTDNTPESSEAGPVKSKAGPGRGRKRLVQNNGTAQTGPKMKRKCKPSENLIETCPATEENKASTKMDTSVSQDSSMSSAQDNNIVLPQEKIEIKNEKISDGSSTIASDPQSSRAPSEKVSMQQSFPSQEVTSSTQPGSKRGIKDNTAKKISSSKDKFHSFITKRLENREQQEHSSPSSGSHTPPMKKALLDKDMTDSPLAVLHGFANGSGTPIEPVSENTALPPQRGSRPNSSAGLDTAVGRMNTPPKYPTPEEELANQNRRLTPQKTSQLGPNAGSDSIQSHAFNAKQGPNKAPPFGQFLQNQQPPRLTPGTAAATNATNTLGLVPNGGIPLRLGPIGVFSGNAKPGSTIPLHGGPAQPHPQHPPNAQGSQGLSHPQQQSQHPSFQHSLAETQMNSLPKPPILQPQGHIQQPQQQMQPAQQMQPPHGQQQPQAQPASQQGQPHGQSQPQHQMQGQSVQHLSSQSRQAQQGPLSQNLPSQVTLPSQNLPHVQQSQTNAQSTHAQQMSQGTLPQNAQHMPHNQHMQHNAHLQQRQAPQANAQAPQNSSQQQSQHQLLQSHNTLRSQQSSGQAPGAQSHPPHPQVGLPASQHSTNQQLGSHTSIGTSLNVHAQQPKLGSTPLQPLPPSQTPHHQDVALVPQVPQSSHPSQLRSLFSNNQPNSNLSSHLVPGQSNTPGITSSYGSPQSSSQPFSKNNLECQSPLGSNPYTTASLNNRNSAVSAPQQQATHHTSSAQFNEHYGTHKPPIGMLPHSSQTSSMYAVSSSKHEALSPQTLSQNSINSMHQSGYIHPSPQQGLPPNTNGGYHNVFGNHRQPMPNGLISQHSVYAPGSTGNSNSGPASVPSTPLNSTPPSQKSSRYGFQ